MSLKKKIAISFFISAAIIAALAAFEYLNFRLIKKEIRFLELTDTVRSKSLQLRRHEKNYFLFSPAKSREQSQAIHLYLDQLDTILASPVPYADAGVLNDLQALVREYRRGFDAIEVLLRDLTTDLRGIKRGQGDHGRFFPLIEAAIYERPFQAAEFLQSEFHLPASHRLVSGLLTLNREITQLRKSGEGVINVSKELDRQAREKVDRGISASQAAIVIIFPLFLATGVVMLFLITRNIVQRLGLLNDVIEKTAKGTFAHVNAPEQQWGKDEVGVLIRKFDQMEGQLEERQAEIERKNQELIQVKKLAAIGTLASGVAHELNNPLNNIYLSIQVLTRELGGDAPAAVKEVAADILSQTVRVKKIVTDLLEFARGREPHFREVELNGLISSAFARTRSASGADAARLTMDTEPSGVKVSADPEQLEQVFINLFANALDAMGSGGVLVVQVSSTSEAVTVRVTDSGPGIPKAQIDKVFEPFFTTKDKGTGLGLAIVFNIVKKHYGEIAVASEEGKGTTFTITLPRAV
jgi:two-component system NtrC family sensor kinase